MTSETNRAAMRHPRERIRLAGAVFATLASAYVALATSAPVCQNRFAGNAATRDASFAAGQDELTLRVEVVGARALLDVDSDLVVRGDEPDDEGETSVDASAPETTTGTPREQSGPFAPEPGRARTWLSCNDPSTQESDDISFNPRPSIPTLQLGPGCTFRLRRPDAASARDVEISVVPIVTYCDGGEPGEHAVRIEVVSDP